MHEHWNVLFRVEFLYCTILRGIIFSIVLSNTFYLIFLTWKSVKKKNAFVTNLELFFALQFTTLYNGKFSLVSFCIKYDVAIQCYHIRLTIQAGYNDQKQNISHISYSHNCTVKIIVLNTLNYQISVSPQFLMYLVKLEILQDVHNLL